MCKQTTFTLVQLSFKTSVILALVLVVPQPTRRARRYEGAATDRRDGIESN